MVKTKLFVCLSCNAEFKTQHDMDERYYFVQYCPFCSEELEPEENYDLEEEEE